MQRNKWLTNPYTVCILAVFCALLWGFGTPAIKIGYQYSDIAADDVFSKILYAGIRFFAAGCIVALCNIRHCKQLPFSKTLTGGIALLALVQTVLQYLFQYIGLGYAKGGISSVISQSGAFLLVFISPLFFKNERFTLKKTLGASLGFLGIIIMNVSNAASVSFQGEGMIFLASAMMAASSVVSKKLTQNAPTGLVTGIQQAIGGGILTVVGLCGGGKFSLQHPIAIGILLFLIFSAAITNLLFMTLFKYNDIAKVAVYRFATPLAGVLFSYLLLGEKFWDWKNLVALALVCAGIFIVNVHVKKSKKENNMKIHFIHVKPTQENMTPVIAEIFRNLPEGVENRIVFEKAEYRFYRQGSVHAAIYSSATKSGENDVVFDIRNTKNVVVDGNGASFVFCDRIQPFLITDCENVTLKNFSSDYAFMRYAYADVTETTDKGFGLAIDKTIFDYSIENGNLLFVCGNEKIGTDTKKISIQHITPLKDGVVFLYVGNTTAPVNPAAKPFFLDAEQRENDVFFRYRQGTSPLSSLCVGDRICLAYDNDREAQTAYCDNVKNILVENVRIYRGGGMGFVADLCENITLDGLRIQPHPNRHEYFSTTADGIFITQCSGSFVLKNSWIANTYDDAINVHGFYMIVDETLGENCVRLRHGHAAHDGIVLYKAGDVVRFSHPQTFDEFATATVKDVTFDENRTNIVVTFTTPIVLPEGTLVENADRMPNVLIENNVVENCPHMRLSSKYMIIRNNRLRLKHTDIYVDDLIGFWYESGAVTQLEITNNTFGEISPVDIWIRSNRPDGANRLHNNVVIKNNRFAKPRQQALRISAVQNLMESDNVFGE